MAAVLFGLLAAVLQISGTFSFQYLDEHDSLGTWLNHDPISRDYRRPITRDFQDFHVDPRSRFTSTEQKFDYQLFPSNWINYKKDLEKFIKPSQLGNALSSDSSITSSRSRLQMMKHMKALQKESRKEPYPNLFLNSRPVVLNTSSLRSSKDVSDGMDRSSIEPPAVLYKNDVQHTSNAEDNGFSTPTLHAKISSDEVANEIPTVPKENKESVEAEDGSINDTPVENDTQKNSAVSGGQKESIDVKDKTINKITVEKEKEDKNANEVRTPVKEETNKTVQDKVEETTNSEEGTKATTSVSEEGTEQTGETKYAEDETSETTSEVISENTPDSSSASEDTLTTKSQITSTKEVPGNSLEDTTETAHVSSISTLNETTLPSNDSTSEATDMSSSDSSPTEEVPSTTKFPVSTKDVTDAPISPTLSTEITDASSKDAFPTATESEFPKSDFSTETSAPPEHVIDIPSIRKAKIVISVVFLVIGLIAVAVLAVYMFRERRKAVKYDQLKLLP